MPRRSEVPGEAFVGRAHEVDLLLALCSAASAGRGSLVVVSGAPGVGKTRLCAEVEASARLEGVRVVSTECWVGGGAPALWPWQPILRQLCGDSATALLAPETDQESVGPDRLSRFQAVVDLLAEACRGSPTLVIVDDVHGADAGALLLLRLLSRSMARIPLMLVLCRRSGQPSDDSAAARILDELERAAASIALTSFDAQESADFLAGHGWADVPDAVTTAVFRLSGGNPLYLRRLAALGTVDRPDGLPAGVGAAIHEALLRLDPEERRLLQVASVLGVSPTVAEVAAVSGSGPPDVLGAVDAASTVGLVEVLAPEQFRFSHEVIRSALEESLGASGRLDAHARAADAVVRYGMHGSPENVARRAQHALAAALRSTEDAGAAVVACCAAARSMAERFAYEQADRFLSAAVEVQERPGMEPPSAGLLVEWAHAALRCGRLAEARRRFERAATVVEREHDPVLLAEIALGLGGHWVNEHRAPVERAWVLGLQRTALAGLPVEETALRCRLRTRLAAEDVYDCGPVEPVYDALATARDHGDSLVLAETLSLTHHALLTPDHARFRLGLADELIRVASEGGHGVLGLMGLCWRAVDLFLLGDRRALRALENLRDRADALSCLNIVYIVDVLDVMLLIRAGRLDEAETAAQRCYELGIEVGEIDALGYLGAHLLGIRWVQGCDAELLDLAEELALSPTLVQDNFAFRATAAAIAARAGHHERARLTVDEVAADGLSSLPRSSNWAAGMFAIVEAAAALGDKRLAREAHALLAPFADQPVMPSLAVVCLGSTERALGIAALTWGDVDRAITHHERALAAHRRLGNRPLTAISRAELATALRRRDEPGDRARAASLLREAIDEADDMEMAGRIDGWRAELATLVSRPWDGAPRKRSVDPDDLHSTSASSRGVIRKRGRGWLIAVDDHWASVSDRVGIRYLHLLLTQPGRPISALELASGGATTEDTTSHELLDDEARAAYVTRVKELRQELAEADDDNDLGRAELLRTELDALIGHLEAATGRDGRSRSFIDDAERARTSVTKAIRRAINEIDAAEPAIARLLYATITTGSTCLYNPAADHPITWTTSDHGTARPGPSAH